MDLKWCSTEEVPYSFSRSSIKFEGRMAPKIDDFNPIFSKIIRVVAAIKSLRFALFKVIRQITTLSGTKNRQFLPELSISGL